jgi:hypothetical protein
VNQWQAARQLKYLLEAMRWPDGDAKRVISKAHVTAGPPDDMLATLRTPFVLISVQPVEPDEEEPELEAAGFDVILVCQADGGEGNQNALMGANRTGGQGASEGRGLLEIEEQVKLAIGRLGGANGVRAQILSTGGTAAERMESGSYVVARRYSVRCWCTVRRHYEAPMYVAATGGAGQIAVTWVNPTARYDSLLPIVRYTSGATAPTSATAGTGATGLTITSASKTITGLSAGTYSVAVFWSYDETGGGSAERYSSQELGTTATSITVS